MRIGGELLAQGNVLGAELIENARWAFVEGMTDAAVAPAIVALVNAYLVKRYMPSGLKKEGGGTETTPDSGDRKPNETLRRVVFPQPDGPNNP